MPLHREAKRRQCGLQRLKPAQAPYPQLMNTHILLASGELCQEYMHMRLHHFQLFEELLPEAFGTT